MMHKDHHKQKDERIIFYQEGWLLLLLPALLVFLVFGVRWCFFAAHRYVWRPCVRAKQTWGKNSDRFLWLLVGVIAFLFWLQAWMTTGIQTRNEDAFVETASHGRTKVLRESFEYNPQAVMYNDTPESYASAVQQIASERDCVKQVPYSRQTATQSLFPSPSGDFTPLDAANTSWNQSLAGFVPPPKTRQNPILAPPIYESELWKPNPFFVTSGINDQKRQELGQSGYTIRAEPPCAPFQHRTTSPYPEPPFSPSSPSSGGTSDPSHPYCCPRTPTFSPERPLMTERQRGCRSDSDLSGVRSNEERPSSSPVQETYRPFYQNRVALGESPIMDQQGYFPNNPEAYGYPVNVPAPAVECDPGPSASQIEYNKNLFYSSMQPGTGIQNRVMQPDAVSSNLGISYTQPQLPGYWVTDRNGDSRFTQYDPLHPPKERARGSMDSKDRPQSSSSPVPINRRDIYDPRYSGYGTAYRQYTEEMTGQPRFFYDDIEAHTQYNYITRNHLDTFDFGTTTGPYEPYTQNATVRQKANDTFTQNTIEQRNDLQSRLMAKNAHRQWQQKLAPLRSGGSLAMRA